MQFQRKPWWCGPAAIQAVLRFFDIKRTQGDIAKRIHCTPEDGTDEEEIKRALLSWGLHIDEVEPTGEAWAMRWLQNCDTPAILCVDGWEHWVLCLGNNYGRYIVFDPMRSRDNMRNNGLHLYTWEQLRSRWRCEGAYYGIGVSK